MNTDWFRLAEDYTMHLDFSYSKICDWLLNIYKRGCGENGIFRIDLNSVLTDWVQDFYKKCGYTPIKEDNGFMQMYKLL